MQSPQSQLGELGGAQGSSGEHRHAGRRVPGVTGGAARTSLAAAREEQAALPRAGAGRRSPGALPELSANGWT